MCGFVERIGHTVGAMETSYRAQVAVAFEILAEGLAPFVDARMSEAYPDEDWILMAASKLGKRRDVLVSLVDPHFQLEVMVRWWGPVFAAVLADRDRGAVTELRTFRNYWAHPDEDHPFDLEASSTMVHLASDLLRAVGSPEAKRMVDLAANLSTDSVGQIARDRGVQPSDVMIEQISELQVEHDLLEQQLREARQVADSAAGRTRAATRQLAELQAQYAAVAGLRDQYLVLQHQLEEERAERELVLGDTTLVRGQLELAENAIVGLQQQSLALHDQLSETRLALASANPIDTEIGRRWLWLMTAFIMVLAVMVAILALQLEFRN